MNIILVERWSQRVIVVTDVTNVTWEPPIIWIHSESFGNPPTLIDEYNRLYTKDQTHIPGEWRIESISDPAKIQMLPTQ